MAVASASCASGESAPKDMPALSKRDKIAEIGSTSSSGTGARAGVTRSRSRRQDTGRSLTSAANCLY